MARSRVSKQAVSARERERLALELRRRGKRYDEIGQVLGITESAAWKAVQRAYQRSLHLTDDEAEFNRKLDLERLDAALAALWPNVAEGKGWAIDRLLGILERRARLLGLDMPQRQETDIGDTLARILEGLSRQSRPADD